LPARTRLFVDWLREHLPARITPLSARHASRRKAKAPD